MDSTDVVNLFRHDVIQIGAAASLKESVLFDLSAEVRMCARESDLRETCDCGDEQSIFFRDALQFIEPRKLVPFTQIAQNRNRQYQIERLIGKRKGRQ